MKRYLPLGAGAVFLLLAGVYLASTGSVPAGQPSVVELNDETLSRLKQEFNRAAGSMRVILLLAPTCPYCLKGAAEIQRVLEMHPQGPMVVFAVWEPILPTDWSKPGTRVLNRLRDGRVRQLWDAEHRVAAELKKASEARQIFPNCCYSKGVMWDSIAAFAPGEQWGETLPAPILLEGTIEEAAPLFASLAAKAW